MKKQLKALILFSAMILTLAACKKETQSNTSAVNGATFFKSSAPAMQTFTINAGQQTTITGTNGTKVTFYPSSLKNSSGTVITSGQVKIELQEMLKGSDMILANMATTSDGKLLISGGQINLKVSQNGEELFVNQAGKPKVSIPTINQSQPMNVFVGQVIPPDTIGSDTTVNWVPADTTVVITPTPDTTLATPANVYSFDITQFHYINCDYFYGSGQTLTGLTVTLPSQYTHTNTRVYIYFPSINSITRVSGYGGSNIFNLTSNYRAPVGMQVKVVVVSWIGVQYYYDIQSVTLTANMQITSTPAAASLSAIQAAISAL